MTIMEKSFKPPWKSQNRQERRSAFVRKSDYRPLECSPSIPRPQNKPIEHRHSYLEEYLTKYTKMGLVTQEASAEQYLNPLERSSAKSFSAEPLSREPNSRHTVNVDDGISLSKSFDSRLLSRHFSGVPDPPDSLPEATPDANHVRLSGEDMPGTPEEVTKFLDAHFNVDDLRNTGLRSTSDLGLKPPSFHQAKSNRTLALLQNPSMRRHVAHSLHLDPDDPDFISSVTTKLMLAHKAETASPRLKRTEDIPMINRKMSASSGDLPAQSVTLDRSHGSNHHIRTSSEQDLASSSIVRAKRQSIGQFHIPSYHEFKSRQKSSRSHTGSLKNRPVSTSFEFLMARENSHDSGRPVSTEADVKLCNTNSDVSLSSQDCETESVFMATNLSQRPPRPQRTKSTSLKKKLMERNSLSEDASTPTETRSPKSQPGSVNPASFVSHSETRIIEPASKCKTPKEQSVRFVEDDNDELILDICENRNVDGSGSDMELRKKKLKWDEITSDLEEELSEGLSTITLEPHPSLLNADSSVSVLRSTSDVSDKVAEESRKRASREKRAKPYKSDPFCVVSQSLTSPCSPPNVIYENTADGLSKDDVLNFLHHVTHSEVMSGPSSPQNSDLSCSEQDPSHEPNTATHGASPKAPIRRKRTLKRSQSSRCPMCGGRGQVLNSNGLLPTCEKCHEPSLERKEAILELVETEKSYCQDLRILRDEFYTPLKGSGLLSSDHVVAVFSNLLELLSISEQFVENLCLSLETANQKGDEDFISVSIGQPFLESSSMLLAFETYCSAQIYAPSILEQLIEEKNLLRLFLVESQKENMALRRMDLKSFLMVPVQRIMKYPLLLGRLAKCTHENHEDYKAVIKAKSRVEEILEHINMQSKGTSSQRIKRKTSWMNMAKKAATAENIELSKAALDLLGWSRHEAYLLHTGRLSYCFPPEPSWQTRLSSLKFQTVYAVLVSLGRNPQLAKESSQPLLFPHESNVKHVALVLLRDKGGKFLALRDPIFLSQCVISKDPSVSEIFELMEMNKDPYLMKGDDLDESHTWFQLMRLHGKDMGLWKRRRKALPNIMMHHKPSGFLT